MASSAQRSWILSGIYGSLFKTNAEFLLGFGNANTWQSLKREQKSLGFVFSGGQKMVKWWPGKRLLPQPATAA